MAKNKKKTNKRSKSVTVSGGTVSRSTRRRALALVFATVLVYAVYVLACSLQFEAMVHIYAATIAVLLCAYVIVNRGFLGKLPSVEDISDTDGVSPEEYLSEIKERRERSRWMLFCVIPFIFTLLIDMLFITITGFFNLQIGF